MQYLALIHADEEAWLALDEAARQEAYDGYRRLGEEAQAAGVLVDGAELAPTSAATTVRVREGQTLVSDGPYAEVKESLGGYFLFECDSIDEAVRWASRIPAASTGGAVEVRPVHVQEED
jgi:hypothetical protein